MDSHYKVEAVLDIPLRVFVAAKLLQWWRNRKITTPISANARDVTCARNDLAKGLLQRFFVMEFDSKIDKFLFMILWNYICDKHNDERMVEELGITEIGFIPKASKE